MTDHIACIVDGHHGIYCGQRVGSFISGLQNDAHVQFEVVGDDNHLCLEDLEILSAGPDHEHYCEAYSNAEASSWMLRQRGTSDNPVEFIIVLGESGDVFFGPKARFTEDW